MKGRTKIWVGGFVVVLVGVAVWYGVSSSDPEPVEPSVQSQSSMLKDPIEKESAPQFNLKNNKGQEVPMIPPNGKPTILNFWASWCGPCKVEMPALQQAYEQYKDHINFQMINVTVDDDEQLVDRLLKEKGYTFPVLLDETGEASEVYQIISIPTTFVINSDGTVQKKLIGAMTKEQVQKLLASLHP